MKPVIAMLAAAALLAGCRPSAPTPSDWRSSSEQAVSDMVSTVATARLTAEQAEKDRILGRYGIVQLTYSEEAAGSTTDSVSTLQPPPAAKPSYGEVTTTLSDAADAIASTRIAVTDDDTAATDKAIDDLDQALKDLHALERRLERAP